MGSVQRVPHGLFAGVLVICKVITLSLDSLWPIICVLHIFTTIHVPRDNALGSHFGFV
jgi:hypothetical protein